jgi:hypothetical protein
MRTIVFCTALLFAAPIQAKILPSFELTGAAKAAANIIVVEDGKIVEVWAGDMKVGDAYRPAELVPLGHKVVYGFLGTSDADADIDRNLAEKGLKRVAAVSGKRLVLFIPPEPPKTRMEKLLAQHHAYSTVWLEDAQAFAIQQWINPGPADMRPLYLREADLKQAVLDVRLVNAKVREIGQQEDKGQRAQDLVALLKPDSHLWNNEVEQAIRECGRAAWPAVEAALSDDERSPLHGRLLHLAHELASQRAKPLFTKVLADERTYFEQLDAAGEKYDRLKPPHLVHEQRRSAAQWALDSLDAAVWR